MPTSAGRLAAMQLQQDFGRIGSENEFIDLRSQNSSRIQLCHSQAKLISTPDLFGTVVNITCFAIPHSQSMCKPSLRALLSIPHLLLRGWSTVVAISRSSTSAVTSGGRGWIRCRRLSFMPALLLALGRSTRWSLRRSALLKYSNYST